MKVVWYSCALGLDPFSIGFESSLMEAGKKALYSLFRETVHFVVPVILIGIFFKALPFLIYCCLKRNKYGR